MKVTTYRCDECPKMRVSDADRWWIVFTDEAERMVKIVPWEVASQLEIDRENVSHICGQACLIKAVSNYIGLVKR